MECKHEFDGDGYPCKNCGKTIADMEMDEFNEKMGIADCPYNEENANSGYPLLDKVRELQGYEPDYGETMTTQSEGRWIEKEAVLKILSKYFA